MKKLLILLFLLLFFTPAHAAVVGSDLNIVTESNANLASGTGITLTTGHAYIAEISYAAADIQSNISTGSWTNLVNITGGPGRVSIAAHSGLDDFLFMTVAADETNADALQLQVVIDGTTILDMTNTSNNSDAITNYWLPNIVGNTSNDDIAVFDFNTSFVIRAERTGTFDGTSVLRMGPVLYEYFQ